MSRYSEDQARSVLGRSFAQFQRDAALVGRRAHLDRLSAEVSEATAELAGLAVDPADAASYLELVVAERRQATRTGVDAEAVQRSLSRLVPGDLIELPGGGGPGRRLLVVIATSQRKRGVQVDALTARGKVVRTHGGDLDRPIEALGHIDLPVPYQPRDPAFTKAAASRLRRVNPKRLRRAKPSGARGAGAGAAELPAARRALEAHHLHGHPQRELVGDLAARIAAARHSQDRRGQGMGRSNADLLERLDAVRHALEHFDHLDGWRLTAAGRRLRSIFHESDLLVSISIGSDLLEGLDPPDLAAMVSCFTHEHRGSGRPPPPRLPTRGLQDRFGELRSLWRRLSTQEAGLALPVTPEPSAGFATAARMWCSGAGLGICLDDDLSGGDFVRNARNLVDLLSQVAGLGSPGTASAAAAAADVISRDVVLGSGAPR
ncbi:MAG: hypothetical protein M5U19_14020 [Microthrixaceae bacterium]|nr:hypothetical protein [Microthrixaceae bacterium]